MSALPSPLPRMAARDTIIDGPESLRAALNIMMHVRNDVHRARFTTALRGGSLASPIDTKTLSDCRDLVLGAERYLLSLCNVYGKPNPRHPDCFVCRQYSITGGPSHDASPRCRSGKNSHCSCDVCW